MMKNKNSHSLIHQWALVQTFKYRERLVNIITPQYFSHSLPFREVTFHLAVLFLFWFRLFVNKTFKRWREGGGHSKIARIFIQRSPLTKSFFLTLRKRWKTKRVKPHACKHLHSQHFVIRIDVDGKTIISIKTLKAGTSILDMDW